MRTRKSRNIERLTGNDAALAGQSVWNYIAEKYERARSLDFLIIPALIEMKKKAS